MLSWENLLSKKRLFFSTASQDYKLIEDPIEEHRSDYYRDLDRVLFSSAFRRMHNKTQVFSMPENDHVHSRLTHSIEVASVGRSLGHTIGRIIAERKPLLRSKFPSFAVDIGDIVHAACLAHDIGNPPFGHAGEEAIAKYFASFFERHPLIADPLSKRQRSDFLKFEGNAQGFRLLTKIQNTKTGGLQLTAATLATFCKYPRESGDDIKISTPGNIATKKFGCFQDDKTALSMIAAEVGLKRLPISAEVKTDAVYSRHPLTFLVEAADNISYTILDLEDGIRLNYVNKDSALNLINKIASKADNFDGTKSKDLAYVRGRAIQRLRSEVSTLFLSEPNFSQIMNGTYKKEIIKEIDSHKQLDKIISFTSEYCYKHRFVIQMQVAGHNIIAGLLDELIPSVLAHAKERVERQELVLRICDISVSNSDSPYQRLLKATDFVSGMSDSYASSLYRRLKGIELSSSIR